MDGTRIGTSDEMIFTAERLRKTRDASLRFLMLWAMTPREVQPNTALIAHDDPDLLIRTLKESGNFNWSSLYSAGNCDD